MRRDDGVTTGEDEVLALAGEDDGFTALVQGLAARPTPEAVDALASRGIEYVVLPAPADGEVAAALDATAGLVQASAEDRSTRAWQVDRPLSADDLDGPRSWLRVALLVLQGARDPGRAGAVRTDTDRGRDGRPAMRRRFGADVLLAIALPVACVLALLLLHPDRGQPHGSAPVETPLTSASVVCPAALPGTGADLLGVSTWARTRPPR